MSKDSIVSSNQGRIFALESQKVPEEEIINRDIGFKDIMQDYKPRWLGVVALFASLGASL